MTTKVEMTGNLDDLAQHLIISVISKRKGLIEKVFPEINKKREGSLIANVELKINGVEIDFKEFAETLDRNWDLCVERAVKDRIGDEIYKFFGDYDKERQLLKEKLFKKLGIKMDEEDYY